MIPTIGCIILLCLLIAVVIRWRILWVAHSETLKYVAGVEASAESYVALVEEINRIILNSYAYLDGLKRFDMLLYGTEEVRNMIKFMNDLQDKLGLILESQEIYAEKRKPDHQ